MRFRPRFFPWSWLLLLIILSAQCRTHQPQTIPGEYCPKIVVKFRIRGPQGSQSGRLHWRRPAGRDHLLFLTPLNQVVMEMCSEENDVLLLVGRRKEWWRGPFRDLLQELWDIDMSLEEIRALVWDGTMPDTAGLEARGLSVQRQPVAQGQGAKFDVRRGEITLGLQVGVPVSAPALAGCGRDLPGWRRVELPELLDED